jgi:hypothetical protein
MSNALINADDFNDDLEDKIAAEGNYQLRITSAKYKLSKKERPMVGLGIAIEDTEDYATIFENVTFPVEDDEPRTRKLMLRNMKRLCATFGIPTDVMIAIANGDEDRVSDLVGSTGTCRVVQEPVQDANGNDTGEMRNVLRLPKVQ